MKSQACVCGEGASQLWATVQGIDIVTCNACNVGRVGQVDPAKYEELYTSGKYHKIGSEDTLEETAKRGNHAERWEHDLSVSALRLQKLNKYYTGSSGILLDIGCANGAFMYAAQKQGFEVHGLDLAKDAAHSDVRDTIRVGDLRHTGFQRRSVDIITFNDSFEHFVDPLPALKAAKGILTRHGILVIEIPDMGCTLAKEQGADFVHVKPHEHLWYFTAAQMRDLLEANDFTILGMDVPIPGKVTLYASPSVHVEEVEVHGPAGVGDVIWTMTKLQAIYNREYPCKIKYVVCCDAEVKVTTRAKDFLLLSHLINSVDFRPLPLPNDGGCQDPSIPMYSLIANDFLDPKIAPWQGKHLNDWHPELGETSYDIGVLLPASVRWQAGKRLAAFKGNYVAVYMSSHIWNKCTLQPHWTANDWASFIIRIADTGIKPVILGAEWDAAFASEVAIHLVEFGREPVKIWVNLIGKTPLPLAMAYMHNAKATFGIAAGLPIIAAFMGWPTAIMWPVRGVTKSDVCTIQPNGYCSFCPEFNTNWVDPAFVGEEYRVLEIGKFDEGMAFGVLMDLINATTRVEF